MEKDLEKADEAQEEVSPFERAIAELEVPECPKGLADLKIIEAMKALHTEIESLKNPKKKHDK